MQGGIEYELTLQMAVMKMFLLAALTLPPAVTGLACKPASCADVQCFGYSATSGLVHTIYDENNTTVRCDFDTDGGMWTELLRRYDGSTSFNQNWNNFIFGFGDPEREFWVGLRFASRQIGQRKHTLRVELTGGDGTSAHAVFYGFTLAEHPSRGYVMSYDTIAPGSTAGNGLCTNCAFHTVDRDGTKYNCSADHYKQPGWFHKDGKCKRAASLLFGRYTARRNTRRGDIFWSTFMTHGRIALVVMKVRRGADSSVRHLCNNPCLNGGVCSYTADTNKSTCYCQKGYSGELCQPTISNMTTNVPDNRSLSMTRTASSSTQACSCSNGGVCNISEGTIICECQEGFKGQFCSEEEHVSNTNVFMIVILILALVFLVCIFAIRTLLNNMTEIQGMLDAKMIRRKSGYLDNVGLAAGSVELTEEMENTEKDEEPNENTSLVP